MELVVAHEDIILAQKGIISDLQHNLLISELAMKKMNAENGELKKQLEVLRNVPTDRPGEVG
jgi:hypothetical protein